MEANSMIQEEDENTTRGNVQSTQINLLGDVVEIICALL